MADVRRLVAVAQRWVCIAALTLAAPAAPGAGFQIVEASTRLVDGVVLLDAQIDFDFSGEALEAMENGVPLTVSVEMTVHRVRRGPDERIARVRARYLIKTHALSARYVVTNLSSGEASTFGSFEELRRALGQIVDFPMLDEHLLASGEDYRMGIRAKLDIEALPAPMRPLAYVSPRWRLKSDWYSWPVAR